jgi:BirA family biotin operon repressor/biotin-[acetyl-CoA-carboxylase] ligase
LTEGRVGPETIERFGRPTRHFPVAVSAEAMALAWANQESGPAGATVVVDHEIGPRGLHGRLWEVPLTQTLAFSVVLRPSVSVEEGNVTWLLAALAAAEAAEAVSGHSLATWWPDLVVEASAPDRQVGAVRSEVQLGPGKVRSAIITIRLDLESLGLALERKDDLLEATVLAIDAASERLDEGASAVAAGYEGRCALIGKRLKLSLLPKGETRGVAAHIDRSARLELESPSGMVEKIGVDQVRSLAVV